MTILNIPTRLGTHGNCRRPPIANPLLPVAAFATPAAPVLGNMALGRSKTVCLVDRVVIDGTLDSTVARFMGVRGSLRTAGGVEGFSDDTVFSTKGTEATPGHFSLDIDKYGYVPDHTQHSPPSDGNDISSHIGLYGSTTQDAAENDGFVKVRYMNEIEAFKAGVRPGAWASSGYLGAPVTLLAAPGVGKFYRIHTLIVIGGIAAAGVITLGSNAVPANAPIFEWTQAGSLNAALVKTVLTDIDIPVPENSVVAYDAAAGFNPANLTIIVGAEIAPISRNRFANLTGVPQ